VIESESHTILGWNKHNSPIKISHHKSSNGEHKKHDFKMVSKTFRAQTQRINMDVDGSMFIAVIAEEYENS